VSRRGPILDEDSGTPPGDSAGSDLADRARRFGHFELLREIARGSMGVVFEARQLSLERTVALKLLRADRFASEAQLRRFQAEARAASSLQHPSIVPVHEIGEHEGQRYLCMALVRGPSLAQELAEGPLPPRRAAEILVKVARAIQFAHERGILHRDLKPHNVLIDEAGHPWVTDFGLAKHLDGSAEQTADGDAVGTPSYMSPEQARGELVGIGPATDVYGLGSTLYAALAGRPPFIAPSSMATLRLVQEREPIELSVLDPHIPSDLCTIAHKALEKVARRRYASAADFADDLERSLAGQPIQARPVGRLERIGRRLKRHPVASGLAAALVVIVLLASGLVLHQWRRTVHALEAKRVADQQRVLGNVQALGAARPRDFAALQQQLDLDDPRVLGLLDRIADDDESEESLRFRARLATLERRPEYMLAVVERGLTLEHDPQEFRLVAESLRDGLRELDGDHRATVLAELDAMATDDSRPAASRFLADLLLLSCDPRAASSPRRAPAIAAGLVDSDPFALREFSELLRPAPRVLLEELAATYAAGDAPRRRACCWLLSTWGGGQPDLLVQLLPEVEPRDAQVLMRPLFDHRELVVERMRARLSEPRDARGEPEDAVTEPELYELEALFAAAHGALGATSGHCLDLPLAAFRESLPRLRDHGYRPLRVRPFRNAGDLCVAATFVRDWGRWRLDWEAADAPEAGVVDAQSDGLVPIDVASFVDGPAGEEADRVLILWGEAEPDLREWRRLPRMSSAELYAEGERLEQLDFEPASFQVAFDREGRLGVCSLWRRRSTPMAFELCVGLGTRELELLAATGLYQSEVDVTARDADLQFVSGLWTTSPHWESRTLFEPDLERHQRTSEELAALGFRPASVSVDWNELQSAGAATSVWRRPVLSHAERLAEDRRRLRAALVLAELEDLSTLLPWLRAAPDPTVRFGLALELGASGVDPGPWLDALESEVRPDVRFALCLALGELAPGSFDDDSRRRWLSLLRRSHQDDPDPGLHALAGLLLERNGQPVESASPPPGARWRKIPGGHTLVRFEGPQELVVGSPGWIPGSTRVETAHWMRVEHPFELSSTEVTRGQFWRFLDEHGEWDFGQSRGNPDEPVEGLSWFEAAAYCRWLSEREGVPEEEMVYPPLAEIGPRMKLSADHLARTGYRLPTETEWELGCRAGARTLYSFGSDLERIGDFANARGPHAPDDGRRAVSAVARAYPNDFGLFDMHGNVMEWCHDAFVARRMMGRFEVATPDGGAEELLQRPYRSLRGGWYESSPLTTGCASRRRARVETQSRGVGFRIARTAP